MRDDLLKIKEQLENEGCIQEWQNNWDSVLQSMQDRATGPNGFQLTRLQRDALQNEEDNKDFFGRWKDDGCFQGKNLIIQAATSAGKTLLSELTVIDALAHGKKALILVPLKSMVKERYTQFEEDFRKTGKTVYASSSDYQENDGNLIAGVYDVGILVYEKLFAMLCQPSCRILENCGLIVVDELTMMAAEARGPKLEVALEIAMQKLKEELRIVCLTTTDCSVEYIEKWLNNSLPHETLPEDGDSEAEYESDMETDESGVKVLYGPTRPVGLDENIITLDDGKCYTKHIPGENDVGADASAAGDSNGYTQATFMDLSRINPKQRQRRVVQELLLKLVMEKDGQMPRTLLFVPSQSGARREAKRLMKELGLLFPKHELDKEFERSLNECRGDSDMRQIKELAKHGIAYHHSSMSYGLREVIEENAKHLDLIVATETLTIGVNLPFEVVIMTDNKVYRGGSTPVALTQQEYKNVIGRAGRLGLCSRGKSYLLINSSERERYMLPTRRTRIESALKGNGSQGVSREEMLAPFYLPQLIDNKRISAPTIGAIESTSLSRCCGAKALDSEKMLQILEEEKLVERSVKVGRPRYRLSDQAEALAPYAFSLYTTEILRAYFGKFDGEEDELEGIQPGEISSDQRLLDLLFMICQDEEIRGGHTLDLAARNKGDISPFRTCLRKALEKLLQDPEVKLLKNSQLKEWNTKTVRDTDEYVTLFRVLAMYYWTRGYRFQEIEKILDLRGARRTEEAKEADTVPAEDVSDLDPLFSEGDLERFAEVCSFHLETASRLIGYHYEDPKQYPAELYSLSCRVKYGMPRELTALASRRIRGIDRQLLLDVYDQARKKHLTLAEYLYETPAAELRNVISDRKRNLLTDQLESRYYEENVKNLEKKLEEDPDLDRNWGEMLLKLETIAGKENVQPDEWFAQLRKVLSNCRRGSRGSNPLGMCKDIIKTDNGYYLWRFSFLQEDGTTRDEYVQLAFLPKEQINASLDLDLREYFDPTPQTLARYQGDKSDPECGMPIANRVLIVQSPDALTAELRRRGGTPKLACGCVLKTMSLIGLICAHVTMRDKVATELLYKTLTDLRGIIKGKIDHKIDNYRPDTARKDPEKVKYQLLLDKASDPTALLNLLDSDKDLKDYRLLSWGEPLRDAQTDLPTVILLDREVIETHRALYNYLYKHGHKIPAFANCRILLDREADKRSWWAADTESFGMYWEGNNKNAYPKVCPDAKSKADAIRKFLKEWDPQAYQVAVSYAHYDAKGNHLPDQKDKITWLQEFVNALNQKLKDECVLFDGNEKASELFQGEAEVAFKEYRKAQVGVVIYDQYYLDNDYCKEEMQALRDGKAGKKGIFYIQNDVISSESRAKYLGTVTNSYLPDNDKDRENLVENVMKRLKGV